MMRSKPAIIGVVIYLVVAACAYAYFLSDSSMYGAVFIIFVAWPGVTFLPIWLGIALNAVIIYFILVGLTRLLSTKA
jgi:hypothetical protein